MDYRHANSPRINAKKVWFIDNIGFMSDKGMKNGGEKAKQYCLEKMLNFNDVIVFDSETEYFRYRYLLERQRKGEIGMISVHQLFLLISAFDNTDGKHHEALNYEADFVYTEKATGKKIVEDVKGSKWSIEEVFYVKWKLFDLRYFKAGLSLSVVMCRDRKNFISNDAWYSLEDTEAVKASKGSKARKEHAKLKNLEKENRKREMEERALERKKTRYLDLKVKEGHRTARQEARYRELEAILKEKGVIL